VLFLTAVLSACVAPGIGGPVAPKGAEGAGVLTLASGRSYAVFPAELAYTGQGTYRWPTGREYDGEFLNGEPEGMGTGNWPGGERYRGTWREGRQHGHGELTRSDGSRYVGDFVDGHREGSGVEQSDEGLYRGDWRNDLPNGSGEFHGSDGAAYKGQWFDGRRQGFGLFTDNGGSRYEGDWYADAPDGFGVMQNANGSVYEGEWRASEQNGYGRMTTEAGIVYEGTWVNGSRHGFGIARRPDGSSYEGEWAQSRREGRGRESFADGSYHDGTWEADQTLGPGTRQDRTGIIISGLWNGDRVSSGLLRLPSGREYAGKILIRDNRGVDARLLEWLESQAAQDDPWAHFFLGTAYSDFAQPQPDLFKATAHFRAAANAGIPDGQFRLALLIVDKSPDQAIDWLLKAAGEQQAQANTLLGEYYLSGRWVSADLTTAVEYLKAGSDAGDMTARNNLAWVLATTADEAIRDSDASLALIRPLALMHGSWQHFDTLAAAYAATGEFDQAVQSQQMAIIEAGKTLGEQSPEVSAMQSRLDQYMEGKPVRE